MMQDKCYKAFHEEKNRMGAELACRAEGGTLPKPATRIHVS